MEREEDSQGWEVSSSVQKVLTREAVDQEGNMDLDKVVGCDKSGPLEDEGQLKTVDGGGNTYQNKEK